MIFDQGFEPSWLLFSVSVFVPLSTGVTRLMDFGVLHWALSKMKKNLKGEEREYGHFFE